MDFNFIDDDYGYGILMSSGHQCICLEPEYVRKEMIQRMKKIVNSYKN